MIIYRCYFGRFFILLLFILSHFIYLSRKICVLYFTFIVFYHYWNKFYSASKPTISVCVCLPGSHECRQRGGRGLPLDFQTWYKYSR